MNCAPSLDIARKSLAAPLSMNVTSLSSTMHARPLRVRATLLQIDLSSLTQGPNRRPCKTHRTSVGVSVMVIFSTFPSLASASDATACYYRKQAGQRAASSWPTTLFLSSISNSSDSRLRRVGSSCVEMLLMTFLLLEFSIGRPALFRI